MLRFLPLIFFSILLYSCKSNEKSRFISESDTSFSAEIRGLSKQINLNPTDAELYYRRAKSFASQDNFKEAFGDIDYAIELSPKNSLYYFQKAQFYIEKDTADAKSAIENYEKSIQLNPKHVEAKIALAKLYMAMLKYDDAKNLFSQIHESNPENALAYLYSGIASKDMKDTAMAQKLFEKTLLLDPQNYDATMQLGNLYSYKNDKLALQYFDKALKINEYSEEALYAKGLYLQKNNQWNEAIENYKKCINLNENYKYAYFNIAYCFLNINKPLEAEKVLITITKIDNEYIEALKLLGYTYEVLKQNPKAIDTYNKILEIEPNNTEIKDLIIKLK